MTDIYVKTIEAGQDWEVDFFRPHGRPSGVAALFRTVYGDDYPVKYYYEPELLAAESAAGRTISTVARTPSGGIVGRCALVYYRTLCPAA